MFQSGQTAQIISAKKKARQEKWWIFPVVLLLCVLSCLAGIVWIWFSYAPHAYLERDVDAYVRSIYGDGWTLQKKSRSADGAGDEYLYEKEGDSFSVFSVSVPVYRADGVASGHYRRGLYDNYFSTVIEKKSEDLEKLAAKYSKNGGPKLEISETGETAGAYGAQYTFCLYLNEGDQIEAAADLLARLDALLAFTGRAGEAPYADMRAKTMAPANAAAGMARGRRGRSDGRCQKGLARSRPQKPVRGLEESGGARCLPDQQDPPDGCGSLLAARKKRCADTSGK